MFMSLGALGELAVINNKWAILLAHLGRCDPPRAIRAHNHKAAKLLKQRRTPLAQRMELRNTPWTPLGCWGQVRIPQLRAVLQAVGACRQLIRLLRLMLLWEILQDALLYSPATTRLRHVLQTFALELEALDLLVPVGERDDVFGDRLALDAELDVYRPAAAVEIPQQRYIHLAVLQVPQRCEPRSARTWLQYRARLLCGPRHHMSNLKMNSTHAPWTSISICAARYDTSTGRGVSKPNFVDAPFDPKSAVMATRHLATTYLRLQGLVDEPICDFLDNGATNPLGTATLLCETKHLLPRHECSKTAAPIHSRGAHDSSAENELPTNSDFKTADASPGKRSRTRSVRNPYQS